MEVVKMSKRNSTVKIVDGKVVFSQEIIDYFESLKNEENSEWIDKYFNILSDSSNFDAEKFNVHHIRPCCTFKDDKHKKRKETQKLGDVFNGNIIKLSVYNHLFAHYYLWKIFNNRDSKEAFQRMCGEGKYIDNLTEDELKEIAKLKEECTNKNKTDEDVKERNKNYYENNKEELKENMKQWYRDNKEHKLQKDKERYDNNREEILRKKKEYYENNREQVSKQRKEWREKNKEKLSEKRKEDYEKNKEKYKKYRENNKEKIHKKDNEQNARLCFDPKEENICTYKALRNRKSRHKEKYKDVILKDCVIPILP